MDNSSAARAVSVSGFSFSNERAAAGCPSAALRVLGLPVSIGAVCYPRDVRTVIVAVSVAKSSSS